ncbi:hypothetical protein [Neoroseomonas rubea]|uniref:hypothetical protein n=1 Tax=Neoroseomonas rubea TaxID=2748666 RepID=UPI0018DF3A0A|nr:hypothetical protein [Roseomonas rubea]
MQQGQAKRRRGSHGPSPLSAATRKRLLAGLLARAEAGDNTAAESLVRLSLLRTGTAAARCPIAVEAPA